MMILPLKKWNGYQTAIFLSSLSMAFGVFREFLIVGMFGFSEKNDQLQLYLSIFFTIGLTIDAMRLSCLNLCNKLSLLQMIFAASAVGLPFSIMIGLMMGYSTNQLDPMMLGMTIMGSYLNLIAALLITYKQRYHLFLPAQIINVMPNMIIIPGMLICYWLLPTHMLFAIIGLTSVIPVVQCMILLLLPTPVVTIEVEGRFSLFGGMTTFVRHFSAMLGEQLFQMITRSAFYNYGVGYLSVFSFIVRLYSAVRFILIDSYIGSRLSTWKDETHQSDGYLSRMLNLTSVGVIITLLSFMICMRVSTSLFNSSVQMVVILFFGFYFLTLVRVVYFKINHHENNASLVVQFALFEFICALFSLLLTKQLNSPILALLWLGYIVKPFAQLLILRKRYHGLAFSLKE